MLDPVHERVFHVPNLMLGDGNKGLQHVDSACQGREGATGFGDTTGRLGNCARFGIERIRSLEAQSLPRTDTELWRDINTAEPL